jgi:hypothetical protein
MPGNAPRVLPSSAADPGQRVMGRVFKERMGIRPEPGPTTFRVQRSEKQNKHRAQKRKSSIRDEQSFPYYQRRPDGELEAREIGG